mgnify:CR=1 FL=1
MGDVASKKELTSEEDPPMEDIIVEQQSFDEDFVHPIVEETITERTIFRKIYSPAYPFTPQLPRIEEEYKCDPSCNKSKCRTCGHNKFKGAIREYTLSGDYVIDTKKELDYNNCDNQ